MTFDLIHRAIVGLQSGKLPADVADWLEDGFRKYLIGRCRLDTALDLPLIRDFSHELNRRDGLIRDMAAHLPDLGSWQQAEEIARLLDNELAGDCAPRDQWKAARSVARLIIQQGLGFNLPLSPGHIRRILLDRRNGY
ncbi:MAG: hypothetical protein H6963_09245 [Chromatiaceae bacterium]|nr:hypothetical protein [Chromatiaceae bacterium]